MQEKLTTKSCRIKKVTIIGVIPSFAFQRAKYCALELHRSLPQRFPLPEIVGLLELDWNEKLIEWRQTLGREYWCLRRPVAVFFDGRFIGSDIELIKLTSLGNILIENIPRKNMSFMKEHFRKDYISYLKKSKRIYCYLDICVDDIYVGTLTFQLFSDLLPRTCENFKSLCLGNRGSFLSYRGSRIHRIVKKGWLQGGDIQYKTGGGGFSVFCDPLEDECFGISHDRRGILSMANGGRHTNGSQFFITLTPSKWMDTHFVAFGRLIEGVNVLKTLENIETFYECPLSKVEIKSCGKLDLEDVESVDAMYREEPMPKKKVKKIETISEQVIRLIMEALTEALAKREHPPDVLDDGDIPSKMNLQLYFQGFYSLPEEILENTAQYLRTLRRKMFRDLKPAATEVVEVIMYDLLMAVLTRMTTLDDVRETIGEDMYNKMVGGINMELEMCRKSHVKRLVDQIVSTAESVVNLVAKKLTNMKRSSFKVKKFQEKMDGWVRSFVIQETFSGDRYHIAKRPGWDVPKKEEEEKPEPHREGIPCCDKKKKEKKSALEALLKKYPPEDICCLDLKDLQRSEVKLSDFFSTCRYGLKRVPKKDDEEERMPLLDLIEMSRFTLRWMRKQENKVRSRERLYWDKKIRKWMKEVVYTSESSWIRDIVFDKDDMVYDHMEEVMYGAMTAGLLEMYYFMEEYLKRCGDKKRQKLVTRTLHPEDDSDDSEKVAKLQESAVALSVAGEEDSKIEEKEEKTMTKKESILPPCTCGHRCCVCQFDPNYVKPSTSVEDSVVPSSKSSSSEDVKSEQQPDIEPEAKFTCPSDMELVDTNALRSEKPKEVNISSFKWLKPYILEKGCDLKTKLATQVHKWLEGEHFSFEGFISKHSLVTRASLLSLSWSLAEILREDNHMKSDVRNFIYDLWNLYFNEIFNEALLEFPPEEEEGVAAWKDEEEGVMEEEENQQSLSGEETKSKVSDDIDWDKFCKKVEDENKEKQVEDVASKNSDDVEMADQDDDQETSDDVKVRKDKVKEDEPPTPQVDKVETLSTKASEEDEENEDFNEEEKKQVSEVFEEENVENEDSTEKKKKKRKTPVVIEEWVDASSSTVSRVMPPYVPPFWVTFLTEITKQVLGAMVEMGRLPRRLYFSTDSELDFESKLKDWFEFNAFNPQLAKGREVADFIALHHKSLTNLDDTARSYLKKKKYTELLNRCSRIMSADDVVQEIVVDVVETVAKKSSAEELEELLVSNILSSAVLAVPRGTDSTIDEDVQSYDTMSEESKGSVEGID